LNVGVFPNGLCKRKGDIKGCGLLHRKNKTFLLFTSSLFDTPETRGNKIIMWGNEVNFLI